MGDGLLVLRYKHFVSVLGIFVFIHFRHVIASRSAYIVLLLGQSSIDRILRIKLDSLQVLYRLWHHDLIGRNGIVTS